MAINLNKAILVGRLGADPESKAGDIVTMRVATSESWIDRQTGDRVERTQWHTVVIFNEHTARYVRQYAHKGDLVCVEGQIETRKWESPEGDKYYTEIIVKQYNGNVQILPKDRQEDSSTQTKAAAKPAAKPQPMKNTRTLDDDEIPF